MVESGGPDLGSTTVGDPISVPNGAARGRIFRLLFHLPGEQLPVNGGVMEGLEEKLGRKISYVELADFFGVDRKWVLEHAHELGGVRIGKRLLFFENIIVDSIRRKSDAVQKNAEGADPVGCPSTSEREARMLPLHDESGSNRVGSQDAQRERSSAQEIIARDRFKLFGNLGKVG